MIYYVDNGERNDVGKPSAKKDYEQMEKSLKSVFGVEAQVRHYSQVSVEEVKALNPQAAVLSGCGTPWEQFIKCDFSKEFELIRSGLLPILGICGGHQIIGMAYGAKVTPLRRLKPGEKDNHVGTPSEGYFYEMGYLPVKIIKVGSRSNRLKADPLFEGMGTVSAPSELAYYPDVRATLIPSVPVADDNPLPAYMSEGNRLTIDVPKGTVITRRMIAPPKDSVMWFLRQKQDELFLKGN